MGWGRCVCILCAGMKECECMRVCLRTGPRAYVCASRHRCMCISVTGCVHACVCIYVRSSCTLTPQCLYCWRTQPSRTILLTDVYSDSHFLIFHQDAALKGGDTGDPGEVMRVAESGLASSSQIFSPVLYCPWLDYGLQALFKRNCHGSSL